jgi:hypothetical protein
MNIAKVIGAVEEQRKDSGRIRVISFKKNGVEITDPNEIKSHFRPDGYVFGNSLFNRDECEVDLNSILEFSAKENEKYRIGGDETVVDFDREVKPIGFPIFRIDPKILIGDAAIDQPMLKSFIDTASASFYILNANFVYGPFKSDDDEIVPKKGKEVNRWKVNSIKIYESGDRQYLLKAPAANDDLVDCMTPVQLVDYLRTQLANQSLNVDFASLRDAIKKQKVKGLDKARMERAIQDITTLLLNYSDIKNLTENSEKFLQLFETALKQLKDEIINEFENEWIKGLEQRKEELIEIVSELGQSNARNQKEKDNLTTEICTAKAEYDLLLQDKERLIRDIKVQLAVQNSSSEKVNHLVTYDEQVFSKNLDCFKNLDEFIGCLNATIANNSQPRYAKTIMSQFKDHRCFLSDNIEPIVKIGGLTNNCRIFIQQVEPDWIKFEKFYENGLKQVWESAHKHKEMFHFLVLQDLNIASIECYGRPILDLISNVRKKLPGQALPFPDNLWLFGIPLDMDVSEEHSFGLPLLKNTFKEWSCFPKGVSLQFNGNVSNKVLKVDSVFQHNDIVPISLDEYFN